MSVIHNVFVLTKPDGGRRHTAPETIKRANEAGLVLLSNRWLHRRLLTGDWKEHRDVFPVRTGTMAAYEKPGKKFGKTIVYTDPKTKQRYVFEVPGAHRGKENCLLAVEHDIVEGKPKFRLTKDGKDLVIEVPDEGSVILVESFPDRNGWYKVNSDLIIPNGEESNSLDPDSLYLWREDGSHIGLVARACENEKALRYLIAVTPPEEPLGALVFNPNQRDLAQLANAADAAMEDLTGSDESKAAVRALIDAAKSTSLQNWNLACQ